MPRLKVKDVHLLIGQASNLTHTFKDLLERPLRMETSRYHLGAFPQPCSREPRAPLHVSNAPIFVAAAQRMPLDCLALEVREACVPGHMGL